MTSNTGNPAKLNYLPAPRHRLPQPRQIDYTPAMNRDQRIPWYKLLGQALADALTGLPYQVSTEEELALHLNGSVRPGKAACSSGLESRPGNREPRARYRALGREG